MSRTFVRAVLVGAAAMAAVLLGLYLARTPDAIRRPGGFNPADFVRDRPKLDAPYVATDYEVVDAMLAMAEVRPDNVVIDLGSGDGRILIAAARSHGARGLGVDIDPARIRESTANAQAAGVTSRVTFRRENLFQTPLRDADVLTLYLAPDVNLRLRPRILAEMRPGTRVVSHDFDMGDWRWDRRQRVGSATIYLWIVPARIAGRWTVTADGRTATLDLEQRYQQVDGTASAGGGTSRVEQGRMTGDQVRFIADLGDGRRSLEGRVVGNRIVPLRPDAGWQAVRTG